MVAYNSENQVVYLNVNIQFPIFKNVALRSQVFIWSNLVNVNEGEELTVTRGVLIGRRHFHL